MYPIQVDPALLPAYHGTAHNCPSCFPNLSVVNMKNFAFVKAKARLFMSPFILPVQESSGVFANVWAPSFPRRKCGIIKFAQIFKLVIFLLVSRRAFMNPYMKGQSNLHVFSSCYFFRYQINLSIILIPYQWYVETSVNIIPKIMFTIFKPSTFLLFLQR